MEQGMTNTIDINLIEEVGDIQKLSVRQDGSKLFSDWHLDRITLTPVDLATDQPIAAKTKTFIFDKVLKAKKIAESGGTPVSSPAKLKNILILKLVLKIKINALFLRLNTTLQSRHPADFLLEPTTTYRSI